MTVDEYYAQINKLGLRPTRVATVFVTGQGEPFNVPDPNAQTEAQRAETIERLKLIMNIQPRA